jgi:hypothetical protein
VDQIVYCVSCHTRPDEINTFDEDISDPYVVSVFSTENAARNFIRSNEIEQLERELRAVKEAAEANSIYQPFLSRQWDCLRHKVQD